ncbi:MAG TPA: hypothetical protein VMZ03_03355 [Chitinophagaceae bacterium]|nr:hypothetical protein [Chitinophagaceae bacterium]
MAKLKYNVVTHGVSGKVGDLLQFRQRNGKTIIAKIAAKSKKFTVAQQLVRDKFRLATAWAKSALKDPAIKEIYDLRAAGDITPYNLALKDFFSSPVISALNTGTYNGAIGNTIAVTATDDTKVVEVKVQVFDNSDSLLEQGAAVQQGEEDTWIYTITVNNSVLSGSRIVVEARDIPGNTSSYEALIP